MKPYFTIVLCSTFFALTFCSPPRGVDDIYTYALSRKADLQLSVYITAQAVQGLMSEETGRREALSLLRANGITKVYIEVYRSGLVVSTELLKSVTQYLKENGFEVVGGIATVPGSDFGVRQEARFSWFNWQSEKTQNDLRKLMAEVATVFDEFIIDDFLCTSDTSAESKTAKGDRTWSQYRRDLLSELSQSLFIAPAKSVNPDITMTIKYPQWYDRFHIFGYDVVRQPALFDAVAVGTESRGQNTQSFGYVQSYESFVNYRWLASLSGKKIDGAWFDHIDCDQDDFIDQAYQSVLAGAKELIIFNYYNLTEGHPGQHSLRMEFKHLADLAKAVALSPVIGVSGYKPPHSDPGGDLYIMDYIGMLGVPLVPVSGYSQADKTIFLPRQAASDSTIVFKVMRSLDQGSRVIVTSGFLAATGNSELAGRAWVKGPIQSSPMQAREIIVNGTAVKLKLPLQLEVDLAVKGGTVLLEAVVKGKRVPFLTRSPDGNLFVLNVHTFSDADFAAVGEVLLCPRPIGLLELPREWVNILRRVFTENLHLKVDAPARVTVQPFGEGELLVQNYNQTEVEVRLAPKEPGKYLNNFNGEEMQIENDSLLLNLPKRSRIWLKLKNE